MLKIAMRVGKIACLWSYTGWGTVSCEEWEGDGVVGGGRGRGLGIWGYKK